jgi:tRNA nucleotidyltransferase/poly(A) polymerase
MIDRIPFEIKNIMHKIRNEGFTSYLVGGCVRDLLMDREPNDFDIASNAMPDDIIRIFSPITPGFCKRA